MVFMCFGIKKIYCSQLKLIILIEICNFMLITCLPFLNIREFFIKFSNKYEDTFSDY